MRFPETSLLSFNAIAWLFCDTAIFTPIQNINTAFFPFVSSLKQSSRAGAAPCIMRKGNANYRNGLEAMAWLSLSFVVTTEASSCICVAWHRSVM